MFVGLFLDIHLERAEALCRGRKEGRRDARFSEAHLKIFSIIIFLGLSLLVALQSTAHKVALAALSTEGFATGDGVNSLEATPDQVILFVLEGVSQNALKTGPMPVLSRLVREGSATWSATGVNSLGRLPTMASLLTGLQIERHGVTWESFDFIRGYPRPPTLFDYLDLSGGKDSAVFFMDESLYQLAEPEPYIDYQMCGALKPECTPAMLISHIRDYFRKARSGHGYGHAISSLPHLLVVHLPQPSRAASATGWQSGAYRDALRAIDGAMGAVVDLYREVGLLNRTMVVVTALSGAPRDDGSAKLAPDRQELRRVPWIAWGAGIKSGHLINQQVSILDTGATILRALGLETYTEWESYPVEEIFRSPHVSPASRQ